MIQTLYDTKRNGLFRDRIQTSLIDRFKRKESMAESHYHPYYELFYVVKGNCRIFVDHSLFFLSQGELLILPPSTLHRTQYEDEVERITYSFTKNYIGELDSILENDFLNTHLQTKKMTFDSKKKCEIEKIFEELLNEDKKNDEFSEMNRKSLLLKLLVFIARNFESESQTENKNEKFKSDAEISIQKAAQYIFENYENDITLQTASEIAGMRDTYFSRKFFEITGYGFKEYLTNIRIQHSQEMLLNGKLTVTQIALACGFTNSNYFGDAFKKITGMSPREFRKNN